MKYSTSFFCRFGYVRVGVSTPEGEWTFGNDNVINDAHPMPCPDEDSKDIAYMRKIFDFLDAHPQQYDTSKIYSVIMFLKNGLKIIIAIE